MKKLSDKHIESVIELIRRYREINASMFHETSIGRRYELDRWKIIQEKTRNYGYYDQFECILCLSVENSCYKCIHGYKSDRANHGCFADKSLMKLQYSKSPEHAVNLCYIRADYLQKLLNEYLNEVKDEL